VVKFLDDALSFDVKAVYLDSGFYDGKCLTLLQAHNFAYIVPVIIRAANCAVMANTVTPGSTIGSRGG
jgi:hypothetical protein